MCPSRWTTDHLTAIVQSVCGLVVIVWLGVQGIEIGSVLPFLLGVAVGAVLVAGAVRSWRQANRRAAQTPRARTTRQAGRPRPALSPDGERELARVVIVLANVGVFAPRIPDPVDLRGPVADHGEPVTADAVLAALDEVDDDVPGFDRSAHDANLAFHVSHGEQFADTLREQIADIVRLAGGALDDVSAVVELSGEAALRVPTRIRLAIGSEEQVLAYDGAAKHLSTVVHVALARVLRARRTGRRLAWLWSDQGVWLSGLPDDPVEELNAALGPAAGEGWEWVDEQAPVAAGDADESGA